jgi:hypothetical protein
MLLHRGALMTEEAYLLFRNRKEHFNRFFASPRGVAQTTRQFSLGMYRLPLCQVAVAQATVRIPTSNSRVIGRREETRQQEYAKHYLRGT